jgi:hypothetical protein
MWFRPLPALPLVVLGVVVVGSGAVEVGVVVVVVSGAGVVRVGACAFDFGSCVGSG